MLGVLAREGRVVRDEIGAIAVLERRIRAEHQRARGSVRAGLPRQADGEGGELGGPIAEAAVRQRAPLGPEGVRGDRLRAGLRIVPMDLLHQRRSAKQRIRRPQRQVGRDAPPLELGSGRAVQDERGRASQPLGESVRVPRHALVILSRSWGPPESLRATPPRVASRRPQIAVRASEPTLAATAGGAPAPRASAPLSAGAQRLAGIELRVQVDADGDAASFDLVASNPGPRPVVLGAVVLCLRWKRARGGSLRFLRHGWQSWSATGAQRSRRRRRARLPVRALAARPAPRARRARRGPPRLARVAPGDGGRRVAARARLSGRRARARPRLRSALRAARRRRRAAGGRAGRRRDARAGRGASARAHPGGPRPGRQRPARELRAKRTGGSRRRARRSPFLSGWCSWYHFFDRVSEADVLRNLEALAAARPRDLRRRRPDRRRLPARDRRLAGDEREVSSRARAARRGDPGGGIHRPESGRRRSARSRRAVSSPSTPSGCCAAGTACCAGCCIRSGAGTRPSTCSIRAGTRCARISSPSFASCARSASTT